MPTTTEFVDSCCRTSSFTNEVSASEARDLLGVAPENGDFLDWLLEPLGNFTEKEKAEAASFILGFPLMMKTRNEEGFIIGQLNDDEARSLSCCAVMYPHWTNKKKSMFASVSSFWTSIVSYYRMTRDGIRMPSFFSDRTKRGRFLKMVQHMDTESNRWHKQYTMQHNQDHLVLFQVAHSNSAMLEQIVKAADACQWPIYVTCSNEGLRSILRDELDFVQKGTERVKDPLDEARGFDVYIMTRQPRS